MVRKIHRNVDEYIASFPERTADILRRLRGVIRDSVPVLTEGISYAIPTFYLNGKYLVYIAGFKNHVSVYPATTEAVAQARLSDYKVSKGTLKFSIDKPVPYDLIGEFVKLRVKEQN